MRIQRAENPAKIDGLEAARSFFAGCFADLRPDRETLFVAHVDSQSRCIHLSRHDGDGDGADIPLRAIIADAASHGSVGLVLAHNHPSGDSRPSTSDCRATRRLAVAAEALDCTLLDHLIFAGGDIASFRRMGLL